MAAKTPDDFFEVQEIKNDIAALDTCLTQMISAKYKQREFYEKSFLCLMVVAFFYFDKIEHIPLLRHWGEGLLILVWLLWIVDCFGRWDNESKIEKYYRELLRGKGGVHINNRINKLKIK